MKNLLYKLKSLFLDYFGDLYITSHFPYISYYEKWKLNGLDYNTAINLLKPGDVIFHGYKRNIEAKIIPSEYSHAGLYLGEGKVVEATGDGVNYSTLFDFMQADRFYAVRCINQSSIVRAISRHELYVGNKYDYDFKDDNDKSYCFELIIQCYDLIKFNKTLVKKLFGLYKKEFYTSYSIIDNSKFKEVIKL